MKILALAIIAMMACTVVSMISADDADVVADGSSDTAQSYSFYLINTVAGEDSTINGWYKATGNSPVDALCKALDEKGIAHTFKNTDASVFFGDKAISDWTTGSWTSDGYYYGAQFAIWNYNEEKGWFMGNTFGMDSDTVYIISHENYLDVDGPVAAAYGIDNSKAWGDPADYDLVYDGVTGGYTDAKMALVVWYKQTYASGDLAKFGISLKEGSEEDDVTMAAYSWMGSFKNEYTSVVGVDCSGSGWGYAQLAPRDLKSTPENVKFGLEAYPSVVEYVIGDEVKTVVHAIGDRTPYTPELEDGYAFIAWYASSDCSGSRITEISGDITLYAKLLKVPTRDQTINSVSIEQFVNGGESVMISVDAGVDAPEKVLIATYSAYVDLPEGTVLNPFITEIVEMDEDQTSAVFTPAKASKVESITVTCWYEIGEDTYSTPYVEAVAPTVSAVMDLTIDQSLTLTFDGGEVEDGDTVDYGYYTVEVVGGSGYTVNGVVADGKNRLFYYGQPLVVEASS